MLKATILTEDSYEYSYTIHHSSHLYTAEIPGNTGEIDITNS